MVTIGGLECGCKSGNEVKIGGAAMRSEFSDYFRGKIGGDVAKRIRDFNGEKTRGRGGS